MRIGIQTWGSEGDIRPFQALAAGLAAAGHEVTLAAHDLLDRTAEPTGPYRLRLFGRTLDPETRRAVGRELSRTSDTVKQLRAVYEGFFAPIAHECLASARSLVEENELVVAHVLAHPLIFAAEAAGRTRATVVLAPVLPSRHLTPGGFPEWGEGVNALVWRVADFVLSRRLAPQMNQMRSQLGLPPVRSVMRQVWGSAPLTLVAMSPTLFEAPPDWPGSVRVCGVLGKPAASAALSPELERFLAAGSPPIYLTFGSMSWAEHEPQRIAELLLEAVRRAGCRAIVQARWSDLEPVAASPEVLCVERAPHESVFPRCAAVVHHGGAGTTQSATAAGCPSIVVAHATDQLEWGERLARRGLAQRPLRRQSVTAASLAAAFTALLADPAVARAAQECGRRLREEDGVARAVELLERHALGKALPEGLTRATDTGLQG
ncbi:MAG: glycosyltransferase family 1 protein [Deltaproteobacteria bacterium]|nr:glycosyltransferase family 1 protein [Deltaproteobacteria bacterium]